MYQQLYSTLTRAITTTAVVKDSEKRTTNIK